MNVIAKALVVKINQSFSLTGSGTVLNNLFIQNDFPNGRGVIVAQWLRCLMSSISTRSIMIIFGQIRLRTVRKPRYSPCYEFNCVTAKRGLALIHPQRLICH